VLLLDRALGVLEGALAIGRQADRHADERARPRLDAVRAEAQAPRSVADHAAFYSVLKGWFRKKQRAPTA
jgi:hypothetical protein